MSSTGNLVAARPIGTQFVARSGDWIARGGMEARLDPATTRWPAPARLALMLGTSAALWAAIYAGVTAF